MEANKPDPATVGRPWKGLWCMRSVGKIQQHAQNRRVNRAALSHIPAAGHGLGFGVRCWRTLSCSVPCPAIGSRPGQVSWPIQSSLQATLSGVP